MAGGRLDDRWAADMAAVPAAQPVPTSPTLPRGPAPWLYCVQYVDALRFGDIPRFKQIEAACEGWWFPTLDRGAGALLHLVVDHGQLAAVKFLIEQRGVEVNQRDATHGWTPLHRCARVAHYRHAPFLQVTSRAVPHHVSCSTTVSEHRLCTACQWLEASRL